MACWHQAYQRPSCPSTISFWHHLQSNSSVSLQADSPRGKKRKKKTHNMLGIREKLVWWDKAYQIIPPLSIVEAPPLPEPSHGIKWEHLCHHLCSSRLPPMGDVWCFCCSTCVCRAALAPGSTGTLRIPPAPRPKPAGRVAQTSPRTTTTWLRGFGGGAGPKRMRRKEAGLRVGREERRELFCGAKTTTTTTTGK